MNTALFSHSLHKSHSEESVRYVLHYTYSYIFQYFFISIIAVLCLSGPSLWVEDSRSSNEMIILDAVL